jgi:hypothetical protein
MRMVIGHYVSPREMVHSALKYFVRNDQKKTSVERKKITYDRLIAAILSSMDADPQLLNADPDTALSTNDGGLIWILILCF